MPRPASSANVHGAAACVLGTAAFGVNDALMKLVMGATSEPQAVFIRGLMVAPILLLVASRRRELRRPRDISRADAQTMAIRTLGEVGGTCVQSSRTTNLP